MTDCTYLMQQRRKMSDLMALFAQERRSINCSLRLHVCWNWTTL